ncbi:MAG: DUF480 domain-containing protein, partial [Ignavibacteria bacterium]|nr:DUF480 domain-containing protein [Ignavibacteria bacterium]MCU7520315.1 DUF480 domain-containing protein [Ignavibacteria bacterium]
AEGALASKLERQTGMKERRYSHLLSGAPEIQEVSVEKKPSVVEERLFSLEGELERLKLEIEELKSAFARFKKQFE